MSFARTSAAVVTLLILPAVAAACGGSSPLKASGARPAAPTPPAATTIPAGSAPPPASSTTAPAETGGPSALPVGAARANFYPFGYTVYPVEPASARIKMSNSPPNTKDVNFAAISSAPTVGPFDPGDDTSNLASWPPACSLTSAAQLHGLFSAITGLDGKPEPEPSSRPGPGGAAPAITGCQFNLRTSFVSAAETKVPGSVSIITVLERAIGPDATTTFRQGLQRQRAVRGLYSSEFADYPSLPDGVSCSTGGTVLECLKGYTDFWIYGQKYTDGPNVDVDQAVWIDQIEIPLAIKLGSELPA
jgi:hypothetical protein